MGTGKVEKKPRRKRENLPPIFLSIIDRFLSFFRIFCSDYRVVERFKKKEERKLQQRYPVLP